MPVLSPRELGLCIIACRRLQECGEFLLPDDVLRSYLRRSAVPPASTSEIDAVLRHLDERRRIHATETETGRKWALTDEGRSWLTQTDR